MAVCEKCWAEATSRAFAAQAVVMDVYVGLVNENWCGSVHRDLTPDEARAEVEAFMGPDWRVGAWTEGDAHFVSMYPAHAVRWTLKTAEHLTYRAAVSALKQAWRDAVRPWMEAAIEAKLDTADVDGYAPDERVIARVCEKGMENV